MCISSHSMRVTALAELVLVVTVLLARQASDSDSTCIRASLHVQRLVQLISLDLKSVMLM
jgi:hypothetical protein